MTWILSPIMMFLGLIFALIVQLRLWLYRRGILSSVKLSKPVISVGNITVGGTGKTPFVDVLITQLETEKRRVGVLSRGYGRKSKEILEVQIDSDPLLVGDEPLWLKRKHPSSQIIVGADRFEASKILKNVDVIILEDGMQNLKIKRDLEITLLDSTQKDKMYRPLPWGRAREGWSALERSDIVVLTKTNFVSLPRLDKLAERAMGYGVWEVIESQTVGDGLWNLATGEKADFTLENKKVYLCSGIARPENFENLVRQSAALILGHRTFRDHAAFNNADILKTVERAQKAGAEMILITEKDAVKWEKQAGNLALPVYIYSTKMTFTTELPSFYEQSAHLLH